METEKQHRMAAGIGKQTKITSIFFIIIIVTLSC